MDTVEIHQMLANRKRKNDESVEAYFHSVVKIARRVAMSDDDIKSYLIAGTRDDMTRCMYASSNTNTLPEFLIFMNKN